jgi:hypothetical protein
MSIAHFLRRILRTCCACFFGLALLTFAGCPAGDEVKTGDTKPKKAQTTQKQTKTGASKTAGPGKDHQAPSGVTTPKKSSLDEVEVKTSDLTVPEAKTATQKTTQSPADPPAKKN